MGASYEFNEHTELLYDSLLTLLGDTAVSVAQGHKLGSGLLNLRTDEQKVLYRPRLVIVSGAANWIGPLIGETVRDEILVIGATRQDNPNADMDRTFIACPGTAKEIHKKEEMQKNRDLEEWEVGKLGSKVHEAEREQLTTSQAELFYERVIQKLGHTQLEA